MKSITGYIRLANEENTILACLESIKDVFDEILIIYSDITDSSLELIHSYTNQKINIERYPYSVIPPHSIEYKTNKYDFKNSLASYYNFGLQFIRTDLVMKIDADQIYFLDEMMNLVSYLKNCKNDKPTIGIRGHNCVVSNNHLYKYLDQPYNGGADHFCVLTKDANFEQKTYWEILSLPYKKTFTIPNKQYWFHMKDGHRINGKFVSGNDYRQQSLGCFDEDLIQKYEKYVLPLLVKTDSVFQNLIYKC